MTAAPPPRYLPRRVVDSSRRPWDGRICASRSATQRPPQPEREVAGPPIRGAPPALARGRGSGPWAVRALPTGDGSRRRVARRGRPATADPDHRGARTGVRRTPCERNAGRVAIGSRDAGTPARQPAPPIRATHGRASPGSGGRPIASEGVVPPCQRPGELHATRTDRSREARPPRQVGGIGRATLRLAGKPR